MAAHHNRSPGIRATSSDTLCSGLKNSESKTNSYSEVYEVVDSKLVYPLIFISYEPLRETQLTRRVFLFYFSRYRLLSQWHSQNELPPKWTLWPPYFPELQSLHSSHLVVGTLFYCAFEGCLGCLLSHGMSTTDFFTSSVDWVIGEKRCLSELKII
jgi:hypothetical protein